MVKKKKKDPWFYKMWNYVEKWWNILASVAVFPCFMNVIRKKISFFTFPTITMANYVKIVLDVIFWACMASTQRAESEPCLWFLFLFVEEWEQADVELEKDVAPNTIVALHHQWDMAVRLACHPGSAECSVMRHIQIVQRHCLSLQSAFDG